MYNTLFKNTDMLERYTSLAECDVFYVNVHTSVIYASLFLEACDQ